MDPSKMGQANGETINTSLSSINESPKKCNLSFSFNFDFDDMNSDNSSDSETADLQIDVSEVDNYEPSSKRRDADEEASVLNEMEEEIERQLDAKAAKTNLTVTNVKNILKHVITNEHVMAMVQKRLHDEEDVIFEPKLTRAKAKELAATQGNIPWPITPVKKTTSEVQVLIEEELPEDSSDEEYNPEQDKQSDDDREVENATNSDIDSQPSTPVNGADEPLQEQVKSEDVRYDPEGIFKIPNIPHVPTEEENIGQRTRSKLCLSETPLEQIEQAFIPPDITTDMYDWDCEVDEDWDNFLKEFTQPLQQDPVIEDDPEADPEYNILEDEETDLLDKEELRADKAVKVTRKELNNLIAELFEFTDTFSKQEQEVSKKRKSSDNANSSMENISLSCSMVDFLPVLTEPELPKLVNPNQRKLLGIQLSQHIQLMVQHFAMTYMHPELHIHAKICKENLNSLRYLSNGPNSAFNAVNLTDALRLVSDWEAKFLDEKFEEEYKKVVTDEENTRKVYRGNKWRHMPKFHPELEKLFFGSKALMYPQLLPLVPFMSETKKITKGPYLRSEENLIALGLEQFLPYIASKPRKFKSKKLQLMDTVQLISEYLLPCRDPHGLLYRIQRCKRSKHQNPIKLYFDKGTAPRTVHYITADCKPIAPKEQQRSLLPLRWQTYINNIENIDDVVKHKHILTCNEILKKSINSQQKYNMYSNIPDSHPLRNPVVNILPKIVPANSKTLYNNLEKDDSNNRFNLSVNNMQKKTHNDIKTVQCVSINEESTSINLTSLKTGDKCINTKKVQGEDAADKQLHSTLVKNSKVTKKSTETLSQLPQLRKMTPRLAKIRSAQNMKLMAQVSSPKNVSSCNATKSKTKTDVDKNLEDPCSLSKVDNEEEIAELMLASTTIKKDSLSRKKAKQARELENIKRLLEAENPLHEEERDAKFAGSYLQKLHLMLESTNPELFRAVIKLCLDYNEKLYGINNQSESESCISSESESLQTKNMDKQILNKDSLAINLYYSICDKLQNYPELQSDFLLFLKPHQAAMIGKSIEYMMLQKMNEFVNVAQIYFAKQPSRLAKMMQAIAQLSSDPHVTLERVHTTIGPILKSHPLVMDLFLQVLPTGKPPESLFAPHLFENLICPVGPHDKNKVCIEDTPELYENVELPVLTSQEDPYGGENCKCSCHSTDSSSLKSSTEHCVSCGTRFLNGRIYLQTSEGLRPAKITFPGDDNEKLENIARVSLKTTDKLIPPAPTKQRRKSSKQDSVQDDPCQKVYPSKHSPTKDSEETDKLVPKPRRGARSPSKSGDQKKCLKRIGSAENVSSNKRLRTTQCKSKREKRTDKKDIKVEQKDAHNSNYSTLKDMTHLDSNHDIINDNTNSGKSTANCDIPVDMENDIQPWTRQEDMILLQSIKEEYSENSFMSVSEKLGNRTVEQVKERCQILLSLLAKMA